MGVINALFSLCVRTVNVQIHAFYFYFRESSVEGLSRSEPFLISPTERASGDTAIFHVETESVAIIHNIHHTQYATQTHYQMEKDHLRPPSS